MCIEFLMRKIATGNDLTTALGGKSEGVLPLLKRERENECTFCLNCHESRLGCHFWLRVLCLRLLRRVVFINSQERQGNHSQDSFNKWCSLLTRMFCCEKRLGKLELFAFFWLRTNRKRNLLMSLRLVWVRQDFWGRNSLIVNDFDDLVRMIWQE